MKNNFVKNYNKIKCRVQFRKTITKRLSLQEYTSGKGCMEKH